jgi:hypothetical protein
MVDNKSENRKPVKKSGCIFQDAAAFLWIAR